MTGIAQKKNKFPVKVGIFLECKEGNPMSSSSKPPKQLRSQLCCCASEAGFFLYPSPADEEIFLEIPEGYEVSGRAFEIIDLNGRRLAAGVLDNSEGKIRIPIGTLEDGMYFFRFADDAETVNLRFLKQ